MISEDLVWTGDKKKVGFKKYFVIEICLFFTGPRRRTDENVVPSTAVPLSDARMLEEETQRFGQHHDQPQLYIDRRGIFNV